MTFTNIASALLIPMTLISYIPQYHRLLTLRSSGGLSPTSTLLNTLVAQGQATTIYYLFKSAPVMERGYPFAVPHPTRDWLNLTQILVQWMCSLLVFFLVLKLPASPDGLPAQPLPSLAYDSMHKRTALTLWGTHTLLFMLSVVIVGRADDIVFNITRNINAAIINPILTLLVAVAFSFQVSTSMRANDVGAVSITTLVLQTITFGLLAISWPFRLILPDNMWRFADRPAVLMAWYPWVGWACVNNAIVAVGQGAVLFAVSGKASGTMTLALVL